jgi:hypothetical protein
MRFIYVLTENEIPFYVGKTKNPKQRESAHKKNYPNSKFEIIDEISVLEWKFWERHYISLYRSWGFILTNKLCYAGIGCDIMTDEHKRKLSEAKQNISDVTRLKYRLAKLGKKNPHSDKTKLKIKNSTKGKTKPMSCSPKRPILQYSKSNEFVKEWNSITEASKQLSIGTSVISGVCSDKRKSAGGFIFKYKTI